MEVLVVERLGELLLPRLSLMGMSSLTLEFFCHCIDLFPHTEQILSDQELRLSIRDIASSKKSFDQTDTETKDGKVNNEEWKSKNERFVTAQM